MENKTIRVWDKTVDSCSTCPLFHWDDCGGGVCSEIDLNIDTRESYEIDKDCPFSKPLSKENIESCGFKFNKEVFGDNTLYFERAYEEILYHRETKLLKVYGANRHGAFSGYINNLPEFRLILKMLNIE